MNPLQLIVNTVMSLRSVTCARRYISKVPGPDGISRHLLRCCTDQLTRVFTSIFNKPLAQSVVPTHFERSTIVPAPKNNKPSCLNDYQPVALTSVIMEVFERLIKVFITCFFPSSTDPLQFASRLSSSPNRWMTASVVCSTTLSATWTTNRELCKIAVH